MESLVQRVDQLSSQLTTLPATPTAQAAVVKSADSKQQEAEQQLSQLENKVSAMEKTLAEASSSRAARTPVSPQDREQVVSKLKGLQQQVENINKDLKSTLSHASKSVSNPSQLVSRQQALVAQVDGCSRRLDQLTRSVQEEGGSKGGEDAAGQPSTTEASASSMGRCMQEILERLQEIGEQLDCLEDESEDSDDEDGEGTTVDEVREQLANLCEFVKQHSRFSDYDWRMMQLLTAQKAVISKDRLEAGDGADSQTKLQTYADRLSLESLILVEMAHLLEKKQDDEEEEKGDAVLHELSVLNSQLLSLHQKLDKELRTLSVAATSADMLRTQADIMAEKIMIEAHLCSSSFSQGTHLTAEEVKEEEEKKLQPKLLASEAIMRSQLDSFIGRNLDQACDELWSSASHLTTRSLVQGELSFALSTLKKQLRDSPHITESVSGVRDFSFQRLRDRHKLVKEVAHVYQEKMTRAFAIIISKESEEMTIVEGPENVLDTVCSEISTIMEKHIQRFKEKVRSAEDTHTAHCWDMVVNRLRSDREVVLSGIRQQHTAYTQDSNNCEDSLEVPSQSLDSSIQNFGEIVSLRSILSARLDFLAELFKMGNAAVLAEMEMEEEEEEDEEDEDQDQRALQKGLSSFVHSLAEALQGEAQSRESQVQQILATTGRKDSKCLLCHYDPSFLYFVVCLMVMECVCVYSECVCVCVCVCECV